MPLPCATALKPFLTFVSPIVHSSGPDNRRIRVELGLRRGHRSDAQLHFQFLRICNGNRRPVPGRGHVQV